jgi:hypothetical protein
VSGTTVAKKLGKEVIQVGTMHSSIHDERMFEYFTTANVASWAGRQADLVAWDPESNTPIMIEYKRYRATAVRFSLAHELGHLELTDGHIRQAYSTAEPRHSKQVVYERKLAKVLAALPDVRRLIVAYPESSTTGTSEDSSTDFRPYEAAWLSWARHHFESRLDTQRAQLSADVPTAHGRINRRSRSIRLDAIATGHPYRLSVWFGTTQLARDYRTAQLRLAGRILAVSRAMLARIVSALARRPKVPGLLLVMLATARHYGHRSEPADRYFLAWVLKPLRPKGAAGLVT